MLALGAAQGLDMRLTTNVLCPDSLVSLPVAGPGTTSADYQGAGRETGHNPTGVRLRQRVTVPGRRNSGYAGFTILHGGI